MTKDIRPNHRKTLSHAWWFKPLFVGMVKRAINKAIVGRNRDREDITKGRFTKKDRDELLKVVWGKYFQLETQIPWEPTSGARLWLRNGALIMEGIKTLIESDIERKYAIELIGDVAWVVYEKLMKIPDIFSRLRYRNGVKRMKFNVEFIMKNFPFGPPSYQSEWVDDIDAGNFIVHRCPYANFYHSQLSFEDARDFCQGTACHLDWGLAELWGGHLERTKTIVGGDKCCDFRYVGKHDGQ
ncbi:MAG: L-2-amino-thiazoline-4-carboxylic acid hydrolase [bacterium]